MRDIPELDNTHLLNLPEGFTPLLGIAVGHPLKEPEPRELSAEKIKVDYL
ncbi:MAG: hypothetical protein LBD12_06140 [Clostridiales Family XIII bacterium]|jgi:hypothetical protein|nr:hypothetical protein [Clostridiales Family XIII bacterium]